MQNRFYETREPLQNQIEKEVNEMPGGDQTGPMGMGPMTGRAAGYCAGYNVPGYMNPMPGRGWGMGWGRGRGGWGMGRGGWRHRHWYYATGLPGWERWGYAPAWGAPPPPWYGPGAPQMTEEQEAEYLKEQAKGLQEQLDALNQRLAELEGKK
jgi:hypothetical protein